MTQPPAGTAWVLYCLVPATAPLHLPDTDIFRCDAGNFSAILCEAHLDEYCGPGVEARMQELSWIGPRACRHWAVVDHIMGQTPVLPAGFATLFTSQQSVRRFMDRHRAAIAGFFERIGNRREWAVKGLWDSAGQSDSVAPLGSGTEYLLAKRGRAEARQASGRQLRAACQEAARELQQRASDFHERRVWNAQADDSADVILNWAFLLAPDQEPQFRDKLDDLNLRHHAEKLLFRLSGPWPPYSFAPQLGGESP